MGEPELPVVDADPLGSVTQEIWYGDARELVEKLPDNIACIIADPPYGVHHQSKMATTPTGIKYAKRVQEDHSVEDAIKLFRDVMLPIFPKTQDECDIYVFTRWDILEMWQQACHYIIEAWGFKYKMLLVWDKGGPGMGDLDGTWGCGHELILYFKKGRRNVPYRKSAVLHVDKKAPSKICHPTEKPAGLIEGLIGMSTRPGELVVDPFAGSGSSLVACQRLGRAGIGIELEEQYVKTIRSRLNEVVMEF